MPPLNESLALAQAVYKQHLEDYFYDDFSVHTDQTGLRFLRGWQRVVQVQRGRPLDHHPARPARARAVGTRRSRIGVLLFGIGGLSLILAPALTANFWGRYTVPMAGPLTAAAAIAIVALWRARRGVAES